ncbi:MAG: HAD family phosphatase [Anaerolineales bacterium]|nr:HAD family phosphatase [Anaerolineales bacterium]
MIKVRAIIFDMDGLLVDSEPLSKQVWRKLLADQGHELDKETELAIVGFRASESARYLCDRFGLELSTEWLENERRKMLLDLIKKGISSMPGMEDLFDALDGRDLMLGIATSSDRTIAQAILHSIGILGKFSIIVSGDMVERGKPAPDIYLAAANALKVSPSACLVLEDSPRGIQAARAAGMRCIAVPNELTAELDLSEANWIFSSLGSVAEWLDIILNGQ